MRKARFILDRPRNCIENMAIDEALVHLLKPNTVVIRIYFWSPTGVSIGRSEPLNAIDIKAVKDFGWCIVRRPTGGGVIVHPEGGEITYSIVLPEEYPGLPKAVEDSAAHLARALLYALRELDVPAELLNKPYDRSGPPLCYARGGRASIIVDGFKVSGSAQVRLAGKLLQHGTLVLRVDAERWARVLRMRPEDVTKHVRGLYDLGYRVDVNTLVGSLRKGFSKVLGLELVDSSLTREELALARSLAYKYSSEKWLSGR